MLNPTARCYGLKSKTRRLKYRMIAALQIVKLPTRINSATYPDGLPAPDHQVRVRLSLSLPTPLGS